MGWGCAAMLAVTPLGIVVRGAVLQQLWGWFVVPLGVTAISLPWALGLAGLAYLMVGTMQPRDAKKGEDPREAALKYCALILMNPLLGLAIEPVV
jgi:hypothetical protein